MNHETKPHHHTPLSTTIHHQSPCREVLGAQESLYFSHISPMLPQRKKRAAVGNGGAGAVLMLPSGQEPILHTFKSKSKPKNRPKLRRSWQHTHATRCASARKSCTFERQKRLSFVRLTCRTRQVLQWFIVLFFSVSERRERGCAPPGARTCASASERQYKRKGAVGRA